jgi:hypothetical protein
MNDYVPEEGAQVRTLTTVYADPDGTGLYVMSSSSYEKLPAGTVGIVEDVTYGFGGTTVLIVVFPGNLRTRLGPTAWEVV